MIVPKKLFFLSLGVLLVILLIIAGDLSGSEFQALTASQFLLLSTDQQNKYIEELAKEKGTNQAWGFIKQTFKGNSSPQSAHDLAHLVGGIIYQTNSFQGISICSPEFAFGCFHGFLDQAFLKGTENLQLAEEACGKIGPINTGPVASCIHGIGHGLASFYQVRNLNASLKECERLGNGEQFCYDGVFMEYQRSASPSFYNVLDPLYPCNGLEEKYLGPCGRNQSQVMMQRFKFSFDQVVNVCGSSLAIPLKEACFDSLGFYTVSLASFNPEQIIFYCKKPGEEEFKRRCLKAAAGELVFQNIPNWRASSQKICLAFEDQGWQNDCLNYTQQLAQDYQRN